MENILKEKLWEYIIHNNPELMYKLQDKYGVSEYLEDKVKSVLVLADEMLSECTPREIIEEICLNLLTTELKPSRFTYLSSLLFEEFEGTYVDFARSGTLTYEVLNIMGACSELFETNNFTAGSNTDPNFKNTLIPKITDYLNKLQKSGSLQKSG
ncbi:hypothetical protein GON26_11230 [Flavobacterium sp. GA093]|uniref:Uncharacterized protein n=1 Tax=Flavobacterium hydrocarbonoxydans TaxID=2683249 RepID=A0A6I4NPS8_9FLAO|nr:hypothetical protein [Flavobacterium hydrocarbonoxydans]MWB94942.1 hypothetical protein [Flavobacterium hydrocarbonoxydans]